MKTKLFLSLLLLANVMPGALAAGDEDDTKARSRRNSVLVTPVDDPAVNNALTSPDMLPNDPKQVLQDYDSLMIALTQKFSATLATIAEAAKRGELSSEQAREMSAEQYQLTHMQFDCSVCGVESKNRTRREFLMLKQNRIQHKKAKS